MLLALAGLFLSCAGTSSVRYGDRIDVSGYPKDVQDAYKVFAVRCSRCHTLARPLNARIRDPEHWVRYVTRMRRNPSSGINTKDAEIILRFLLYYTEQLAAEEDADSNSHTPPSTPPAAPQPQVVPSATAPASSPSPEPTPTSQTPAGPGNSMTDPASDPNAGRTP
ncbi:MAG TPA: hypothetical protein VJV78_24760 [Polyangiales bacterium]|nr:hypothetical protein [Polyangiales bacterium]